MGTRAESIIDLYERHAGTWVTARAKEGFYERVWLDRFLALIPSGGSVLDLGCGTGKPIARYFGKRGYTVTGVDSSPSIVSMFRALLPGQRAFVADMREWSLTEGFDGIIAWDSFFHLNLADQRRMFPIFRTHSAPCAALMFTSGPACGESIGSLAGEPLYHASLDPAEYRELLAHDGFAVVATLAEDQACGGRTVWLAQRM